MASIITILGEKLFAQKAQANQQLDIDTFIFANVPGQDPTADIDRNEGVPPLAQQVLTQAVQQVGRVNENVVVYSTVLDSVTGPFDFNWVGLYSSVNDTLVAINHIPTTPKTVTAPGVAGNTLNRNFGIEYSGIAELTGINVAPGTWQLDFTARLSGMDELTRQLASDMNGKDWFIDNGFKVEPRQTANTFKVLPGIGYVNGLRIEQEVEHILTITEYPKYIYVDAYFEGDASSIWKPQHSFTVSENEISDYIDNNGKEHYVIKLAVIHSAETIEDLRDKQGLKQTLDIHSENLNKIGTGQVIDLNSGKLLNESALYDPKIIGVAAIGQSVMAGGVGGEDIGTVYEPLNSSRAFMLGGQPIYQRNGTWSKKLSALSERNFGEESIRVTIASSFLNWVINQELADNPGNKWVFTGQAWGAMDYADLKKGGSTGVYEKVIDQIDDVFVLQPTLKYEYLTVIHGETDGLNNNLNYEANLVEWQSDFNTDVKVATGQTEDVLMLLCQVATAGGYGFNGGITDADFVIPQSQLDAQDNNALITMVTSKYHLPYNDRSHITNLGQRILGEYYGKALAKLRSGVAFSCIRPISIVRITASSFAINYDGVIGNLVFDTSLVTAIANQGFDYVDDSANTITSVTITGPSQVTIQLSGTIGANPFVSYAYHNGSGGEDNQIAGLGDRGNLRDEDPARSRFDTSIRLYNWAVIFKKVVPS